jgi:hypothetical protein
VPRYYPMLCQCIKKRLNLFKTLTICILNNYKI